MSFLEKILEHLPDPVFVKSREHKWLYLNQAFCSFVGFSREEMLGKSDYDFFPKEYADVFWSLDELVFENKRTFRKVERIINAEGEQRVIATKRSYSVDDERKPIIIGTLRDITEVAELRENDRQVNKILRSLALGASREEVLRMILDAAEAQFPGMTASILEVDSAGKRLRQAIDSKLPEYFRKAIEGTPIRENMGSCGTAAHRGQRVIIEDIQNHSAWKNVKDLTREANLASCWSEPVVASNGKVVGTFALYYDQSRSPDEKEMRLMETMAQVASLTFEHHRINEEKSSLENLLVSIIDSMPSEMIGVDHDCKVVLWNKEAEKRTGITEARAKGEQLSDIYPDLLSEVLQAVDRAIQEGNPQPVIKNVYKESRKIRHQDIAIYPLKTDVFNGVVIRIDDITEKMQIEEAMIQTDKMMSIGVLAGGIAHDFNNILVGILGNLSLASQYLDAETKPYKIIEKAEKASIRAKSLANQLLTFAKGGEPVRKSVNLESILQDATDFVLSGSGVQCNFFIDPQLWPVQVDTDQIGQVVQNLIINAKDAMEHKGVIDIRCYNVEKGDGEIPYVLTGSRYVATEIRDSGPGISPEDMKHIFDPYFTTKKEGSGLGLAVCHSILQRHDGFITAKVSESKGGAFLFYLPASDDIVENENNIEKSIESSTSRRTILIMDDDDVVCEILSEMLDFMGHETIVTHDGEHALRVYDEKAKSADRVDLVIMDLTIPSGMGGKEAIGRLHKKYPEAKVIVTSGYSNDPIVAKYEQYGFSGALTKPFQLNEVTAVIQQVLII